MISKQLDAGRARWAGSRICHLKFTLQTIISFLVRCSTHLDVGCAVLLGRFLPKLGPSRTAPFFVAFVPLVLVLSTAAGLWRRRIIAERPLHEDDIKRPAELAPDL